MAASKNPANKPAKKPSTSALNLTPQQITAATSLYNAFAAVNSTTSLAKLAVGLAENKVLSLKESAAILGVTTTTINDAAKKKIDGTGASDENREKLLRAATNRLGIEFKETAFAAASRAKGQAVKSAAKRSVEPTPAA